MSRGAGDDCSPQRSGPTSRGSVVVGALLKFTVLSLAAGVLIAVATLVVADRAARSITLDDARTHARGMATRLAAPLVDERVRAGVPDAVAQLSRVMEGGRMRTAPSCT